VYWRLRDANLITIQSNHHISINCVSQEGMSSPAAIAATSVSVYGRSVVDYVTQEELMQALSTVTPQAGLASTKSDWLLPVPDPEAEEQTVEGEMSRLLTLKSYLVLDAEKEEAFDKLTQEACDIFGVPTSLISLIDLGRQFFLSNTNTAADAAAAAGADAASDGSAKEEVRETPRSAAFCAHTILNKKGIVVVNDTQQDDRFKESPLVTQAPHLRFYAGAPLISPEGTLRYMIIVIMNDQGVRVFFDADAQWYWVVLYGIPGIYSYSQRMTIRA
jgi:hypothetical protein